MSPQDEVREVLPKIHYVGLLRAQACQGLSAQAACASS